MSALRTALKPALTPALGSARRGVSRYFTTFDDVASSYISINTAKTLNTSSVWSILFSCQSLESASSDGFRVFNSNVGSFLKIYDPTGAVNDGIRFRSSGGPADFIGVISPLNRNALNHFRFDNDGAGALSLYINGVFVSSQPIPAGLVEVGHIGGGAAGSDDADGIISDFIIYESGVITFNYPINRYYTPQSNIVLDESGNGNNGTFVNIAAGRSKYYQQRADGNFVDLQGNVLEVAY